MIVVADFLPEIGSLERVNGLGPTHVRAAKIEIGGLNNGRLLHQAQSHVVRSRQAAVICGRGVELRLPIGNTNNPLRIDSASDRVTTITGMISVGTLVRSLPWSNGLLPTKNPE